MMKTQLVAALAALVACGSVHAQTKALSWTPPSQPADPAKRVPANAAPTAAAPAADAGQAAPQATTYVADQPQPAQDPAPVATYRDEDGRGGWFVGVQGGKGWVYDDVDQSALMVNAGYRWRAGQVSLLGVEVAAGRLDETRHDGWQYDEVDYTSIGFNGRFNFGVGNPVYGLVRAGYWAADTGINDGEFRADVDGGYFGLGLGVDFNRHFNMSLVYTNHVYFNEAYWEDGEFYYDANRADTLMLGVEARF